MVGSSHYTQPDLTI